MVSTPSEDLLAALSQLGFGQYEARAYCALLGNAGMNGHEAARASGIPPSKIYETLARLAEKGAVLVQHGEPVRYAALPRETVLAAARAKFERALETAEAGLARLPERSSPGRIWSLTERDAVLAAMAEVVGKARENVFAAVWSEELSALRAPLEAASARGCAVHVAIYGTGHLEGPHSYDLTLCGESAVERMAGRRLAALVADEGEAVIGEFRRDGTVEAIKTDNAVIGLLVVEYIKADILGMLLIDDMGEARFRHIRNDPGLIEALLSAGKRRF